MTAKQPILDFFRQARRAYHPLRKIKTAARGLKRAVLLDFSVQYKVVVSLASLGISVYLDSLFHFLFVLSVTAMMLVTEILNTAIEALCDHVEPKHNESIALVKDMAAGAAVLSTCVWLAVIGFVVHEFVFSGT